MARRLLLDPREIGPIRLLGVGFSGLSEVRQESLFPDLEMPAPQSDSQSVETAAEAMFGPGHDAGWRVGDDVAHPDLGRRARRGHRPVRDPHLGPARTFPADSAELVRANPVDSLDWPDYVEGLQESSAPPAEDVGGR